VVAGPPVIRLKVVDGEGLETPRHRREALSTAEGHT
jgi:hypothetical protein